MDTTSSTRIETVIEDTKTSTTPTEPTFQERARAFEEEIKPISEKWGIILWAGLQQTQEAIVAVPMFKDTKGEKK